MKITYQPKGAKKKPAMTNLGTFAPGETKLIGEDQVKEAKRLVAGGEFVEAGASKKAPQAKPEPKPEPPDEKGSDKKK